MQEIEDLELQKLIEQEENRQKNFIRLIPSENYTSETVRKLLGSILVNKYSEGYPGKRYYEGTDVIDTIENLAIKRAKDLFGAEHANVQPYSGSPANMGVYFALIEPGSNILGMSLTSGGHITHGLSINFSGKFYKSFWYDSNPETGYLEMDKIREMAKEIKPSLIVCGGSAYPRQIDFAKFREIADEVGAKLLVDMAHFSGLVAGKVHPSPVPYADCSSMSTHKVLRGPRGGMILCKNKYAAKIDRSIFPGLQGGPHNHTIAALAAALKEASTKSFQNYAKQILLNAKILAEELLKEDFNLVSGGTDTHLILIDLRNKNLPGKLMSTSLAKSGIITNANTVPGETGSPKNPSGLRLGTPAVTTRGMKEEEMKFIAKQITKVSKSPEDENLLKKIKEEVLDFCKQFKVIPDLV